ncbi:MAG: glucosaminidase domain-containing protein [Muribaculaceae bacterium]|nr:glucosaminidase domain-containing protein [Muribaculaceae bacterium]
MCYKILNLMVMLTLPFLASAQFHTITKENEIPYFTKGKEIYPVETERSTKIVVDSIAEESAKTIQSGANDVATESTPKCNTYTSSESRYEYARARGRKPRSISKEERKEVRRKLPELTIPNLYEEIKRNNIKYPKIVLAQAILETGWFKSSVCRNKNNLFGLTNPRTKNYYEFDHWTESVAAYYSKVQYRYKSGNYLLWLKKIGYAEDPGYIQAVIRVLRQL